MMAHSKARPAGVMDTMHTAVAAVYAQGLLDCVALNDEAELVACELEQLVDTIDGISGARELFTTALLSGAERRQLVQRVFAGRVSKRIEGLLAVMAKRGRLDVLWALPGEFRRLLRKRCGRVEATIRCAFELDDALTADITAELSKTLGGPVFLRVLLEPNLVGGAVLQVGDRVYDGSVTSRLQSMRRNLSEKLSG